MSGCAGGGAVPAARAHHRCLETGPPAPLRVATDGEDDADGDDFIGKMFEGYMRRQATQAAGKRTNGAAPAAGNGDGTS